MLKKILHNMIQRFERQHAYKADYLHVWVEQDVQMAMKFSLLPHLSNHRRVAPVDVFYIAKLTSVQFEGCGPCLQLCIDEALQAGLTSSMIQTLLNHPEHLEPVFAVVHAFTLAVCHQDQTDLQDLRSQLIQAYDTSVVNELAMVIAIARVYPVLKRGMGYAQSCQVTGLNYRNQGASFAIAHRH